MTTRTATASAASTSERGLIITRTFDAPRELVWKAWTEPERVMRWWGPKEFTAPFCTIELRVGGSYHICMRSHDGQDYWSTGRYRDLVEPARLIYTDSFADADGRVVPASHYGMAGEWPLEMLVMVTLENDDGKTRLTLRHVGIPAGEMRELCTTGWNESLDKLSESLTETTLPPPARPLPR